MSTNASGLKAEDSKNLKERSIQAHERHVITALKEVNLPSAFVCILMTCSRCIVVHRQRSVFISCRTFIVIWHPYLYQDTFGVYANDAVFHDPVGIATGPKSIQAQFIALAKVCLSLEEGFLFLIALSCFLERTYRNSEYWRTRKQPLITLFWSIRTCRITGTLSPAPPRSGIFAQALQYWKSSSDFLDT
jgi:hypothetical protein